MALMAWGPYLETGHREMDQQHRDLVDLLNQVHAAQVHHDSASRELLLHLQGYVESHFRWEEELMDRLGFPQAAEHKASHDTKRLELARLVHGFQNGGRGSLSDWMEQMHDWMLSQIINEDRILVEFLHGDPAAAPAQP